MKKARLAVFGIAIVLIALGGCRGPRYYTRYKQNSRQYDQHYDPYSRKWYSWSFRHGII